MTNSMKRWITGWVLLAFFAVGLVACNIALGADAEIHWTAVADDGADPASGPVASYVLAYSTDSSLIASNSRGYGWDPDDSLQVYDLAMTAAPGAEMVYTVTGLHDNTTYYFSIKAYENSGTVDGEDLYSELGNIYACTTADETRPSAVIILNIY